MSVPFEPIVPPPSVPPLDNPPPDPDRIPGEEPLPDQNQTKARGPTLKADHRPTWGLPAEASAYRRRVARDAELERELPLRLEDLVDTFVVDGAKQEDVFDAIIAEIGSLRTAYDRDPDPADDRPGAEAEEPSNEGPGALP